MTLTENEPRDQAKTVHIGTGIPIDNVTVTDAPLANVKHFQAQNLRRHIKPRAVWALLLKALFADILQLLQDLTVIKNTQWHPDTCAV